MKQCTIVVAVDRKYGIGLNGKMPWHFSEDLRWFKAITSSPQCDYQSAKSVFDILFSPHSNPKNNGIINGSCADKNAVVMGYTTWLALQKKPLPKRVNLVVTKKHFDLAKAQEHSHSVKVFSSVEKAIDHAHSHCHSTYVIGGASIYRYVFENRLFTQMLVTHLDKVFHCDRFFPNIAKRYKAKVIGKITSRDIVANVCYYS